jgi:hypothetical protein
MKNFKLAIDKLNNQFNKEVEHYASFIKKNSWTEFQISIMKNCNGIQNIPGILTINVYLPERKRAGWLEEECVSFSFNINGELKVKIFTPKRLERTYRIRSKKKIELLLIGWIKYKFLETKKLPKI